MKRFLSFCIFAFLLVNVSNSQGNWNSELRTSSTQNTLFQSRTIFAQRPSLMRPNQLFSSDDPVVYELFAPANRIAICASYLQIIDLNGYSVLSTAERYNINGTFSPTSAENFAWVRPSANSTYIFFFVVQGGDRFHIYKYNTITNVFRETEFSYRALGNQCYVHRDNLSESATVRDIKFTSNNGNIYTFFMVGGSYYQVLGEYRGSIWRISVTLGDEDVLSVNSSTGRECLDGIYNDVNKMEYRYPHVTVHATPSANRFPIYRYSIPVFSNGDEVGYRGQNNIINFSVTDNAEQVILVESAGASGNSAVVKRSFTNVRLDSLQLGIGVHFIDAIEHNDNLLIMEDENGLITATHNPAYSDNNRNQPSMIVNGYYNQPSTTLRTLAIDRIEQHPTLDIDDCYLLYTLGNGYIKKFYADPNTLDLIPSGEEDNIYTYQNNTRTERVRTAWIMDRRFTGLSDTRIRLNVTKRSTATNNDVQMINVPGSGTYDSDPDDPVNGYNTLELPTPGNFPLVHPIHHDYQYKGFFTAYLDDHPSWLVAEGEVFEQWELISLTLPSPALNAQLTANQMASLSNGILDWNQTPGAYHGNVHVFIMYGGSPYYRLTTLYNNTGQSDWYVPNVNPLTQQNDCKIKLQFDAFSPFEYAYIESDLFTILPNPTPETPYIPRDARELYIIRKPIIIDPDLDLVIHPSATLVFCDSGKLVVPSNATITFLNRDEEYYGDSIVSQIRNDDGSLPASWNVIEVQTGGQVIGMHAKFENLPKAIKVTGGTVDIDSMEFVNCDSALQMTSGTALLSNTKFEKCNIGIQQSNGHVELNDALFDSCGKGIDYQDAQSSATLKVYDSRFLNGTTGINAASNLGDMLLSNCMFDSQFVQSVKIYKSEDISIDQCNFNGLSRYDSPHTSGLYIERCSTNVRISNCDVKGYNTGANVVLSNINLDTCNFESNKNYGVSWSNNHPTATLRGRIHSSTFSNNNGLDPDWAAGFYAYACSPQVTCCTFDEQQSHGALLEGNPTPWFYNKYDESVHANIFNNYCTTYGYPSVSLLDNAAPVFGYNRNNFYPTDDADVVMVDFSPNVLKHYVQENHYDFPSITIDNFYPNDTTYWQYSPGSAVGNCNGDTITGGVGGMEMLVQGDEYAGQGNYSAALESYQAALIASGEATEIAAAAIAAISEIDPTAVSVGTELEQTAQYCATYTYDALGDFTTSDAIRETILSGGDATDSARVEYDLAVSELLRPSTMAVGQRAEAARERAMQHREAALLKLQKARGKLNFAKTQSQPQPVLPMKYALHPVYPNPFNVITNIRFDLPEASNVKVSVFDAMGRLVTNLVDGNQNAGYHNVQWNGTTNSSGVYFVTIHTNKYTATRKAVLLK